MASVREQVCWVTADANEATRKAKSLAAGAINTAPVRILAENGRVAGLECLRTELGPPDDSGRRRPVSLEGSAFVIGCDAVIPAIGQQIDAAWAESLPALKLTDRHTIVVDPATMQTALPHVFAAGDAVSGTATAIEAVAADLAGTSRLAYPKHVRLIRVMCTGMVDPQYVIKAFLEGADGVLISGCHPGDRHYINGNYNARWRVKLLKEILPCFGIDEQRLKQTWIGASDGIPFVRTMTTLVSRTRKLGPILPAPQMVI